MNTLGMMLVSLLGYMTCLSFFGGECNPMPFTGFIIGIVIMTILFPRNPPRK